MPGVNANLSILTAGFLIIRRKDSLKIFERVNPIQPAQRPNQGAGNTETVIPIPTIALETVRNSLHDGLVDVVPLLVI
jgi:hypothetical protein